jgi:hypothetical protein
MHRRRGLRVGSIRELIVEICHLLGETIPLVDSTISCALSSLAGLFGGSHVLVRCVDPALCLVDFGVWWASGHLGDDLSADRALDTWFQPGCQMVGGMRGARIVQARTLLVELVLTAVALRLCCVDRLGRFRDCGSRGFLLLQCRAELIVEGDQILPIGRLPCGLRCLLGVCLVLFGFGNPTGRLGGRRGGIGSLLRQRVQVDRRSHGSQRLDVGFMR